ncbi:MAG: serine/threonine-protein kinase [Polyangiaceae bacterium]
MQASHGLPGFIRPGHLIAGKYELMRPLGRGSMGEVWVARHRSLGEDVALKLLIDERRSGEVEDRATAVARFLLEAQVAAHLSTKTRHIVRVTDHAEEQGLAYLVMELLEGQTLEKWLMLHDRMPLGAVVNLVAQIARGLARAHGEGVVHRDLKPSNIFLAQDEDGKRLVKLLDFGIARALRVKRVFATAPGVLYGTPGYVSPEQLGASGVDHRCDLWAVATVAYEALTGELPLPGTHSGELLRSLAAGRIVPIHERAPDLPRPLGAFFERAFAANIAERYPDAEGLALAFKCAAGRTGESVRPSSRSSVGRGGTRLMPTLRVRVPVAGGSRGPRFHPAALLVAVVVVAALLAALSTLDSVRRPRTAQSARAAGVLATMGELAATPDEATVLSTDAVAPMEVTSCGRMEAEPRYSGRREPPPRSGERPSAAPAPTAGPPPSVIKPPSDKSRIL